MASGLVLPQFTDFKSQTHAIMLIGVSGHSSIYEAGRLARRIAGKEGVVQHIMRNEDKTGIAISQIRELYTATRPRSTGSKRIWIIEDAETMSLDAQNAFLKLLEEPPADVIFILCVKDATILLPTIRSRVQSLQCQPVKQEIAQDYLQFNKIPTGLIPQLLFLMAGSASELVKLTSDDKYRQAQLELAAIAKRLISAPTYEKIIIIQKSTTDRERTLTILRLALQMLMMLAPQQAEYKTALSQLTQFLKAFERISQNGNAKIQLLQAVL